MMLCSLKLRELREKNRVSLRAVAKRMGISAAYLSDVELGRRNLTVEFADRYIEAVTKKVDENEKDSSD